MSLIYVLPLGLPKERCKLCNNVFPDTTAKIVPGFDLALTHFERWTYQKKHKGMVVKDATGCPVIMVGE